MSSCQYNVGGPPLNSDISGIGVRISFYLQTIFLGFLSARSGSIDEIAGALYTLMATNTAMAVAGLILGLKPAPEIAFQDAVVILYLLSMSWIVVIASFASCTHLSDNTNVLQLASAIQSYVILAFAFAVLATADSFGSSPECNQNTVAVIFRPFSALKSGRIFGWIVVSLAFTCYTAMTARDYTSQILKKVRTRNTREKAEELSPLPQQHPPIINFTVPGLEIPPTRKTPQKKATYMETPTRNISGELVCILIFILVVWAFFVLNAELVIRWNQSAKGNTSWQFGQILPMMLTVLPLVNMITAFNQFGFKSVKQVEIYRNVKVTVLYDRDYDDCISR